MAGSGGAPANIEGMFTVADHEIYLSCSGGPGPTVILEAAVGEDHTNLLPIAQRMRNQAFTCVYDRTGVGRSTKPQPAPTARDHVAELHELLELAGVARPAVFVGHSYGGIVSLMETVEHPEDVAGLILVDSSHPNQEARLEAVMSDEQRNAFRALDDGSPYVNFRRSLEEAVVEYGPLPAIPLTIITATHGMTGEEWTEGLPGEAMQAVWLQLQDEHARLRPDSRHIKADTGHYVHVDDPDIVVDEINHMLESIETSQRRPAQAIAQVDR